MPDSRVEGTVADLIHGIDLGTTRFRYPVMGQYPRMKWRFRRRPLGHDRRKQIAVIGLGRFGMSLGQELVRQGHEVLGVDADANHTNAASDRLTHVVQADSSDERVLQKLDLHEFDAVMLAIGEDVESSVSTALLLKEIGVKRIWAKARDKRHKRVLELIGVDKVVLPEHEMGEHVATLITADTLLDYFELTDEHVIAEIVVGKGFGGKSLRELDLRVAFRCNVVGVYVADSLSVTPHPDEELRAGDIVLLAGNRDDVTRVEQASGGE